MWQDKSKNLDVFFCTNTSCDVLMFRERPESPYPNDCPKCFVSGSLVRSWNSLHRMTVIHEGKPKGESE